MGKWLSLLGSVAGVLPTSHKISLEEERSEEEEERRGGQGTPPQQRPPFPWRPWSHLCAQQ